MRLDPTIELLKLEGYNQQEKTTQNIIENKSKFSALCKIVAKSHADEKE